MRFLDKNNAQKGAAGFLYIVVGIAITIGAIFLINRYQGRGHDIILHVPKVEVR